ncbi:carbohydrate ABC transporter permease [Pseudonocardia sp. CA-107938]|uniref:carbohydrate ABC transporter permease n=1 Tax=Pseudonocardia sp. CA-107938 TaxID=3240021 RepID=UPI003D8E2376
MTTLAHPRSRVVAARPARSLRPAPVATYVLLTAAGLVTLVPFGWVFAGAFRSTDEIRSDPGGWLPVHPTFDNFVRLFRDNGFAGYLGNSLLVAAMMVLGNLLFASMAGYALAKLRFAGKRLVFGAVMVALMVPFAATFVPQFVVTVNLGLVDTLPGIALPTVVLPIAVFVMRQFAQSLPDDLFDAARIDGAGELRIFGSIFLPLTGPALATQAILTFLFSWNNFIWPLIVAQSDSTYTLPVGLAAASQQAHTTDYGLLLAGAVVVMLPVLVLFLLLQKYFIQGIAATGLK